MSINTSHKLNSILSGYVQSEELLEGRNVLLIPVPHLLICIGINIHLLNFKLINELNRC